MTSIWSMEWVTVYVVAQLLPIYLSYFKDEDFYYNSITSYSNNDSVAEKRALHEKPCLLLAEVITLYKSRSWNHRWCKQQTLVKPNDCGYLFETIIVLKEQLIVLWVSQIFKNSTGSSLLGCWVCGIRRTVPRIVYFCRGYWRGYK